MAAGIPVLLALTAVAAAIGLLAFPSHIWPADDAANSVILLIGLAVGVDYSLFYIRREREERALGKGPEAALEAAAATSGRAVLLSGLTVLIAMAGMFLTGEKELTSVGVGAMLVVATAVLGSLTVLPALLSMLGDRIERGRLPLLGRRRGRSSALMGRVVEGVLRRPVVSLVLGAGLLVALAVPAFALHTNNAGETALPHGLKIAGTHERIEHAFPGGAQPAYVVLEARDVTAPPIRKATAELLRRALASGELHRPVTVRASDDRTIGAISIGLAGSGTDAGSEHALELLRTRLVPGTLGTVPGVEVHVGGLTAESKDFNDLMKRRAPLVFAFVLGLAFLLLLSTFRSLVVAAKAIVLNLLSVGAAYGVLVAVFQHGWARVAARLPLERRDHLAGCRSSCSSCSSASRWTTTSSSSAASGRRSTAGCRPSDAVSTRRSPRTAGIVTSAALVMVGVFALFAHPVADRAQAARRRARRGDPDRRDDRPRSAAPVDDEAARRAGTGTCPAGSTGCPPGRSDRAHRWGRRREALAVAVADRRDRRRRGALRALARPRGRPDAALAPRGAAGRVVAERHLATLRGAKVIARRILLVAFAAAVTSACAAGAASAPAAPRYFPPRAGACTG